MASNVVIVLQLDARVIDFTAEFHASHLLNQQQHQCNPLCGETCSSHQEHAETHQSLNVAAQQQAQFRKQADVHHIDREL